jgi:hypothetical protein
VGVRLVAVPETDGELAHHLGRLEEVLLILQPYEPGDEPPPLGLGQIALEALQRISGTVAAAERGPTVELMASGGTFELIPLRFVELDEADLAAVGEAVAALGLALMRSTETADVLAEFADRREHPSDLVSGFARAHGLLDLDPDEDTRRLAAIVGGTTGRTVLDVDEERAYKRLTDRALAMFHLNDPLERFAYRGLETPDA